MKGNSLPSELTLSELYESISAGVVVWDHEGKLSYANTAARDLIGLPKEYIMGVTPTDPIWHAINEDGTPSTEEENTVIRVLRSGKPERAVVTGIYSYKAGETRWLQISSEPIIDHETADVRAVVTTFVDITELKQTEDSLAESESEFRSLFTSMAEGVAVHEVVYGLSGVPINYRIIDVNPQYEAMLNIPRNQVVGKLANEAYKTSEPPYLMEFTSVVGTGKPYRFETYFAQLDKYFSISVVAMGKGDFATIFFDVSDRIKMERDLQVSRERLQMALDAANDGLYDWNIPTRRAYFSPHYYTMLGYEPGEFEPTAENWMAMVHPDDMPRVLEASQNAFRPGAGRTDVRYRVRTKSGAWRWVMSRGRVVERDPEGNPIRIVGVIVDIDDLTRTELDLRRSEEKFRHLVERTTDWIWETDSNMNISYSNPKVYDLLGYTPEEMVGTPALDTVAPEALESTKEVLGKAAADKAPFGPMDTVLVRKDGQKIYAEASGMPVMDENGKIVGFRGIIRDVTARRLEEERRLQLERELEAQKRQFYRDTIYSVTNGKLTIGDRSDVAPFIDDAVLELELKDASDLLIIRHQVESFCRDKGLKGERLGRFIIAVGEAMTNATKHSGSGTVYAGYRDDCVWVAVSDNGKGIESLVLPKAVLQKGFSTKASLGLGYSIMLEYSDEIILFTGPSGTTVVLIEEIKQPLPVYSLENLRDTWV